MFFYIYFYCKNKGYIFIFCSVQFCTLKCTKRKQKMFNVNWLERRVSEENSKNLKTIKLLCPQNPESKIKPIKPSKSHFSFLSLSLSLFLALCLVNRYLACTYDDRVSADRRKHIVRFRWKTVAGRSHAKRHARGPKATERSATKPTAKRVCGFQLFQAGASKQPTAAATAAVHRSSLSPVARSTGRTNEPNEENPKENESENKRKERRSRRPSSIILESGPYLHQPAHLRRDRACARSLIPFGQVRATQFCPDRFLLVVTILEIFAS